MNTEGVLRERRVKCECFRRKIPRINHLHAKDEEMKLLTCVHEGSGSGSGADWMTHSVVL